MSSCCYSQQWDLFAPFGAVSLPLVNPSLPFLPTCHFSCATETQLDLNLIARGLGCLHEFHSSRVHYMSGIEPDTFSRLFHLILMGTPSLEMKRLIRRLSCLPRVIQLVSQRSVIWTGFCVQAHTPLYLWQLRASTEQQYSRLLLTYTRCQRLRNVALSPDFSKPATALYTDRSWGELDGQ